MSSAQRHTDPTKAFPRRWSAQVLQAAPLILPARHFVYPQQVPGEEDALNRGALLLHVQPAEAPGFLATCALGFRDPALPSGLWASPHPDKLLALAGGYAYWIDTQHPQHCDLLEQRPVTAVLPAAEDGLLLLAGFQDILALGAEGVRWRTARLTWEGLTLHEIRDGTLYGKGWDMFADADVPFAVDLSTGAHEGGGYRR